MRILEILVVEIIEGLYDVSSFSQGETIKAFLLTTARRSSRPSCDRFPGRWRHVLLPSRSLGLCSRSFPGLRPPWPLPRSLRGVTGTVRRAAVSGAFNCQRDCGMNREPARETAWSRARLVIFLHASFSFFSPPDFTCWTSNVCACANNCMTFDLSLVGASLLRCRAIHQELVSEQP